MRIPRPQGEVGRKNSGGYNLEDALGWDTSQFQIIKNDVQELCNQHLDLKSSYLKQEDHALEKVIDEALKRHPVFLRYLMNWPLTDIIKQHLKNKSSRARQQVARVDAVTTTRQKRLRSARGTRAG